MIYLPETIETRLAMLRCSLIDLREADRKLHHTTQLRDKFIQDVAEYYATLYQLMRRKESLLHDVCTNSDEEQQLLLERARSIAVINMATKVIQVIFRDVFKANGLRQNLQIMKDTVLNNQDVLEELEHVR